MLRFGLKMRLTCLGRAGMSLGIGKYLSIPSKPNANSSMFLIDRESYIGTYMYFMSAALMARLSLFMISFMKYTLIVFGSGK